MTQAMTEVSKHYALGAHESEAIWFTGCLATIPARGEQTGGKLAMVEFTHPAGYATPHHRHDDGDEAFYVLEGAMRGYCGEQTWRATKGSFVWLPRGIPHGYAVDGDETLRTLAITLPAGFASFVIEVRPIVNEVLDTGANPIATREAHRGMGIGSEMFAHLLNEAKSTTHKRVVLQASADGLGIYARAGLSPTGTVHTFSLTPSYPRNE